MFLECFKIYRVVILLDVGFVVLKGGVYFGYILNIKLICFVCYIYGVGMKW